ncbi:MAG: LPS export ABC transporter periplasmic protein LptC [Gemmatimonadaceae bacterium]
MRALVCGVASIVGMAACSKGTQPPVANEATLSDSAEQVLFDVRSNLTTSGVKRGLMLADTVFVFNDQTRFALRRVRANFNTEIGMPNGTLRGDRGTYNLRTKILEGFGNVVVTSTDGKRLTSNHLRYAENLDQISSDSAFVYTEVGRVQRGIGFTTDPNLKVFRCLRACRTEGDVQLGNITP